MKRNERQRRRWRFRTALLLGMVLLYAAILVGAMLGLSQPDPPILAPVNPIGLDKHRVWPVK